MKKIILLTFFLLISFCYDANSQNLYDNITPKPRMCYFREIYSAMFSIPYGKKIYLNPNNPSFEAAFLLNQGLKKSGLDTLDYTYLNENDTLINGVVLGITDTLINQLLTHIPDQRIQISESYPGKEGYIIDVTPAQAIIAGCDNDGLFYGINTFLQIMIPGDASNFIMSCRIVDAPELSKRWFYHSTNFLVGSNTTTAKELWSLATQWKLNGVHLNDFKFGTITTQPQRYLDSLLSVKEFAKNNHLKIIPGVMPFGYSSSILFFNPNLASGLPVRSQKLFIEGDTGRLVPATNVEMSNGGFENYNGNNFPGFAFIDSPGEISFVDNDIKHSGNASIRMENFSEFSPDHGHARICYETELSPFKMYHVSGWVRTENLNYDLFSQIAVLDSNGNYINYTSVEIPLDEEEWTKVDITFNSLNNSKALIYWGLWGAKTGKIWWDDLKVEEIAFVNLLRREGTPVNVSHWILDVVYEEGIDYDSLVDPLLGMKYSWPGGYTSYHIPPTFKIKKNSMIHNGDTVLVSYYNAVVIYDEQVVGTMTDPEVYKITEREFKLLDSVLKPETYFMQHDEIRTMNWDYGDQLTGKTPAQILADNVITCKDIIKKYNPEADIWVWSDMFDNYHNAIKNYYLVNGDLTDIADLIPKSIGMVNWNSGENTLASIDFFSSKGFRQISAPFYDNDQNHIRIWKENTRYTDNFYGMMYTTWGGYYGFLPHFGEYSWNHAPYIYHYPLFDIKPNKNINISILITGDKYDEGWQLDNAQVLYRTVPTNRFTSQIIENKVDEFINTEIELQSDNVWLQYYILATDNRGWSTRIPFGDNQYYELGEKPVSNVNDNNPDINCNLNIYPNPVINNILTINYPTQGIDKINISIIDVLGLTVSNKEILINNNEANTFSIDISDIPNGFYYLKINNGLTIETMSFIKSY